jgi:hypothetical protein
MSLSLVYTGRPRQFPLPITTRIRANRSRKYVKRSGNGPTSDQEKRIADQLLDSGLSPDKAREILKSWQEEVGHELTPEDLRKILVGQSQKALALVIFSTLLDVGAAYGAFAAGGFLGLASEDYGLAAIVGQAIAYLLAGYYVTGAVFDAFKIVTVVIASLQFNVNSAAFLGAVESISKSGLNIADKATEAVNSVKVAQAMKKIVELLQDEYQKSSVTASIDMLSDLGAYLTLAKAESMQNFDASEFGLTEKEAGEIASIFARFDLNDDGVISRDEFKKICAQFSPEIQSDAEISAALSIIDTNKDGTIDLKEFVRWWQGKFSN